MTIRNYFAQSGNREVKYAQGSIHTKVPYDSTSCRGSAKKTPHGPTCPYVHACQAHDVEQALDQVHHRHLEVNALHNPGSVCADAGDAPIVVLMPIDRSYHHFWCKIFRGAT